MKKIIQCISVLLVCLTLGGCGVFGDFSGDSLQDLGSLPDGTSNDSVELEEDCVHVDNDGNELCDLCDGSVVVTLDFYGVNDLHGKFLPNDSQNGVGGLTTYFKEAKTRNPNTILLSSGDMWQGSSESNLTHGMIINDWMSEMDFVSMTLGNHEFDWGADVIAENAAASDFPFLAINIYERETDRRVDYCQPSVMVQRGGAKIGIIGAIGNCYSSISADKVTDVYFKTGSELTDLVKAEAQRLKAAGADCIVYSMHDDDSEYNEILSGDYVDLVFEGHTHQSYVQKDGKGVYHLQGGGENRGVTYAAATVNVVENTLSVQQASVVRNTDYQNKTPDPIVEALQEKYAGELAQGTKVLGKNDRYRNSTELCNLAAQLYLEAGLERWGEQYDIVLGGGFFQARSPYDLSAGEVTYSQVQSIFPFDNPLVLCKISGSKLKSQFLETNNSNYFVSCSSYGESIRNDIRSNETYYIVIDTYSSLYTPNGATEIARYDETTFARDLIAKYIEDGGMTSQKPEEERQYTSYATLYEIGEALANNEITTETYYVKGTIVEIVGNRYYGNMTICDEFGNTFYVYGTFDQSGNRYGEMTDPPVAGDAVILYGAIKKYVNASTVTIELVDAIIIA